MTETPTVRPAVTDPHGAAAYLAVSRRTLETWRREKRGPAFLRMDGVHVRYRYADLDAWIAENMAVTA